MQVKKCIALFASAAFAMLTLAGCGGSDHSELAARTVNEAQKEPISVEFTTDKDLTQSLKDALKDTTDPSKLVSAIQADEDLTDLLTGAQIGVYTAGSQQSPEEAAQHIANQVVNTLSGKQDTGYITMVETEDGTYYAITLVYGSGSGNGSGGSSQTATYEVTVTAGSNGSASPSSATVKAGGSVTVTVTPDPTYEVNQVTATNGTVSGTDNTYTVSNINSDTTIHVTFKKCDIAEIKVTKQPDKMDYWTNESFDPEGMVVSAVYKDGNYEPITGYTWDFNDATGVVTISYGEHKCELKVNMTNIGYITMWRIDSDDKPFKAGDTFDPVGLNILAWNISKWDWDIIPITREMVDNGEVTFDKPVLHEGENTIAWLSYRGHTATNITVAVD